jgi:hypothetical protein
VPNWVPDLPSSRTFLYRPETVNFRCPECQRYDNPVDRRFPRNPIVVPFAGRNLGVLIRPERRLLLRILFVMFVYWSKEDTCFKGAGWIFACVWLDERTAVINLRQRKKTLNLCHDDFAGRKEIVISPEENLLAHKGTHSFIKA